VTDTHRIALVTGCSRAEGIGIEVCRQLAQQNITVYLTARDAKKAWACAESLRDEGLDVQDHALDISSSDSIAAVVKLLDERYGRLDILVNNATGATQSAAPVSIADLAEARGVMDVTLFGTWQMIQMTLPLLNQSDSARIVNVSSSSGLHSDPTLGLTIAWTGRPAYGIAKAALNALTAKFAVELRDTHIKINAVCPGLTASHPGMAALGAHPVSEGASGIVWAATLADDGPSGNFYRDGQLQSW
jgi:NAD(P)-dependent dehydrogenase (short-subunit alcohol dehydrogenase family)